MACPEDENSTDCLLRELLKAINDKDEEFNWDPLNFAFTVPIGLVAALFAALTIFQAILSAGSGRRRCNKIAIGRWSKLTTKRWSWHDLMFLSTAKTPLLRSNSILKLLNDGKSGQQNPGNSEYASTDQSSNATSAATWLNFLQEINLEDLALSGKDANIAETAADYLPSDFLAVPAYGEVGFIVAMAAAAGAYSWQFNPQSPYPVIIGEDFQFDFRQHPTLGTVGAFSRYVQRAEKKPRYSRKYLAKAIEHARGEIDIATLFPFHETVRKQLSLKEGPVSINIVELPDFQDLLRGTHGKDYCTGMTRGDLCRLPWYFDRNDEHLLWLFVADTPKYPPAIFPSGLIHVPNLLSILALNSKFWATEYRAWKSLDLSEEMPDLFNGLLWRDSFQVTEPSPDPGRLFGYKDIYQGCIKILYEPQAFQAWFDSKGRSRRQEFRQGVVAQLQQVDRWLQKKDDQNPEREQDIRCSIVNLYRISNALLKAENAITNGSLRNLVPADEAGAQPIDRGAALDDEYLEIVVNRHTKTLTALRKLVDECLLSRDMEEIVERYREDTIKKFMKHSKILQALVGYSPSLFSSLLNFSHIVMLLKALGKLLKALENTKEEEQSERSDIETIKNVVIWRCILIYLLFWTAPDNSKILTSGSWQHVIPMI